MMSRHTVAFAVAGVLLVALGAAAAVRDGRGAEVHPLGDLDPAAVFAVIADVLSPEGSAVLDEDRHLLLVTDCPERQTRVREVIEGLRQAVPLVRIEGRLVDRESGLDAAWGATGQILLRPAPGIPGSTPRPGARAVDTTASRQSVVAVAGGRATLRIGREIPFAGALLRYGKRHGYLEAEAEWREVETSLGVEASAPAGNGRVRLALTPEFGFSHGRTRRSVAFADQRCEVVLAEGGEVRLAVAPSQEAFYRQFLAGYDALRRVRAVDLVLRASVVRAGDVRGGSH